MPVEGCSECKAVRKQGHILILLIQIPRARKALQLWHDRLLQQQLIHLEEGINQGLFCITPLIRLGREKFLSLQHNSCLFWGHYGVVCHATGTLITTVCRCKFLSPQHTSLLASTTPSCISKFRGHRVVRGRCKGGSSVVKVLPDILRRIEQLLGPHDRQTHRRGWTCRLLPELPDGHLPINSNQQLKDTTAEVRCAYDCLLFTC